MLRSRAKGISKDRNWNGISNLLGMAWEGELPGCYPLGEWRKLFALWLHPYCQ